MSDHDGIMVTGRDTLGKLVRDRIPDIIRRSGRTPRYRTLSTDEYRRALIDKLNEEVGELAAAENQESILGEAADVVEVVAAIAAEYGADLGTVLDIASRKRTERGGFGQRLWLSSIDESESAVSVEPTDH
ncbi:phosphoribosyl-ATP pyrophosphohydrolase [Mycolicibacterium hassiacum]|uniref:phosphoribosyl-ATP pyrophosphohydrolase n=1 Tax=Mycolicibacterium hassiacum TaxID=46351 RepID=UPI00036C4FDC|nr:phosphoribosyl-ATP pyrophosphohydrolase [Mycolicibacterium hassiacum]MDA4088064.1 phosphoribosyl-ATP pyrophosphohydrolase [Mycolicibacterium hassiacum DSM 44199]